MLYILIKRMFSYFYFKQSVNKIGWTNYYTNFVINLHVNSCPYDILAKRWRIKISRSDLKQQTQQGKITIIIGIRIRGKRRLRYTAGNDCRHPNSYFHSSVNVYLGEQFMHFSVDFNQKYTSKTPRKNNLKA